jgi:hypothetical protein
MHIDKEGQHLFFECVLTKKAWEVISAVAGFSLGFDYESIAKLWLCIKRFGVINVISSEYAGTF